MANYQSPYAPVVNINMESPLTSLPYSPNPNSLQAPPSSQHKQSPLEPLDDNDDPNKSEAYKLIQ